MVEIRAAVVVCGVSTVVSPTVIKMTSFSFELRQQWH